MRNIILTNKAPKAVGPYSQAIDTGNTLYVSGQIPVNPQTGQMVEKDIILQTRQVMENIRNIIFDAGYSMENVVKCTCLLTDLNSFKSFNEVYEEYFKNDPPARATFQVAALPLGAMIEVDAIAVK